MRWSILCVTSKLHITLWMSQRWRLLCISTFQVTISTLRRERMSFGSRKLWIWIKTSVERMGRRRSRPSSVGFSIMIIWVGLRLHSHVIRSSISRSLHNLKWVWEPSYSNPPAWHRYRCGIFKRDFASSYSELPSQSYSGSSYLFQRLFWHYWRRRRR